MRLLEHSVVRHITKHGIQRLLQKSLTPSSAWWLIPWFCRSPGDTHIRTVLFNISNTTSVQAYEPSENLLDYAQTKSAQVAFTKSLAKQLAKQGIRVNAIAPGPYWTPLQVSGGQPQSKIEQFGSESPMGRPGQPAELAPIYVLLASQESSYATGQVYGAAGGSGNP